MPHGKPISFYIIFYMYMVNLYQNSFFAFLQQERGLSPSTISNHASSLIYPLKYLYRNLAPNFAAVPLIAQLRRMATILQKKGDLERPKTREDLKALNKWLDW